MGSLSTSLHDISWIPPHTLPQAGPFQIVSLVFILARRSIKSIERKYKPKRFPEERRAG